MPIDDFTQHVVQLALLVVSGALLAGIAARGDALDARVRRVLTAVLAVAALGSVLTYTRMGQFHGYGRFGQHIYHYHDIWHYAIGAKYYPELGYDHLYNCSWVALQELGEDGHAIPKVDRLLDLSSPNTYFDPRPRRDALTEACHDRFGAARWEQFKEDQLEAWLKPGFDDKWWQVMLRDLGFNPPPSWAVVGHSLTRLIPFTPTSLEWLPAIDLALIYGVGGFLVYRAFGPLGLVAYLVVFGNNWLASYRWTGGSYCRQLWFAFLVSGVSLLQLRRHAAAGVALGMAMSLRLFPAVFVFGALVALARDARRGEAERRALLEFGGAAAATTTGMVVASLLLFDPSLWSEFADKMSHHGNTFFTWHIGFKKWAIYGRELFLPAKRWAVPGLQQSEAWQQHLHAIYDGRAWLWEPLRVAMSAAAVWVAWGLTPARAVMVVGSVLLFTTSIPANYYYVYLAGLAAVFVHDARGWRDAARIALIFAMLVSVSASTWVHDAALIQNGWINRTMFWFFALLIASLVPGAPGVDALVARVRAARDRPTASR